MVEDTLSLRVLVVDDQEHDRMFLARTLNACNSLDVELYESESLSQAKRALLNDRFDIVIVDQGLGDGEGVELLRAFPATPMIMLTGGGDEEVAVRALRSGARDYLIKKVDGSHLSALPHVIRAVMAVEKLKLSEEARAQELEETNRQLRRFSKTVANVLATPLESISSYLGHIRLAAKSGQGPLLEHYLDAGARAATKARAFLIGLRQYTSLTKPTTFNEPVDLNRLLVRLKRSFQDQLELEKAELSIDALPDVLGGSQQILMAFNALLENALRYAGEKPKIWIAGKKVGDRVLISFCDDGPGFPEGEISGLADVFVRGSNASSVDRGNGVGLALVKRVLELNGGGMQMENHPEGGALVTLELPSGEAVVTRQRETGANRPLS